MIWESLLDNLDYHHRKWYECDDNGDWIECSFGRACAILDRLAPGEDHNEIIKRFHWRDREATARDKEHRITRGA